jgi:hypothetical protein
MALSIIQSLQQIIAKMLVMLIIKKLLGAFGGGSSGGGGIFDSPLGVIVGSGGVNAAEGDFFTAKVGGRIIRVAEGGHDEVVLSTDPKHRNRTAGLLAMFLQKTKMLSDMATGGWMSADGLSQNILSRIPSFEAGDFVTAGGPQLGGGNVNMTLHQHFPNVRDHRDFKLNQAASERDAARAVRSGIERFRK